MVDDCGRGLTGLLSSEPQPGWRGWLLKMGRMRSVMHDGSA
jgi:hypothetical protein